MKGRRVFVSGGAGVIGLEMVAQLVDRGAEVLVGDLKPRPSQFPPQVRYRQGDLNGMGREELGAFGPDIFIHLAATFERSTESAEFWSENFRHNIRLSHHLMTIARDLPSLKRVIFASSYLIYDPDLYQFETAQAAPVALAEADPVRPRNLTGMAKLAHEIELQFLDGFDRYGFTTVMARIYRGYGRNSRDVISRWVRALLHGEPITVFRPEGLFDYIYAKDSAEGLLRLAACEQVTGIINLGTGRARRVSDIVEILRGHFPDMKAETADSDIPFEASQADVNKLETALGWVPGYDLETAIPEIIAHERARLHATETKGKHRNVLITSASRKAPLVRAMKQAAARISADARVIAGDMDPDAPARHAADGFWQMPRLDSVSPGELIEACRKHEIGTVLPTRDGELLFWAKARDAFAEAGIDIIVSPPQSVERCLDKLAFTQFGAEAGLPFIPASTDTDSLAATRFVVKERFGAGSLGIGLDLDREEALSHAARLAAPIFQPFVAGPEISIDAWMDNAHRPRGLILRRRDRVVGGESQTTTTFRDPEIEEKARQVLGALQLRGPVVLQAIVTDDGELNVIECNARFGGASTASIAAGLDSLYWSLAEFHMPDAPQHFHRIAGELRQVRMPEDIILHDPDL
ncbi:NAD-dependent epimerase/dehydratase family protein [Hoeflea poritis]|uniref:ATP-grasp domain-containing protein n=1 Tax=Hoeflea poritis TaxID=2993659 RepID=A0ABT4VVA0_9HYPH|nr:NAD-dependent epimerase/dehydratase family protein [Hoeflea poritis]MDA4848646.1 ATP-grasp domain-containing protein [Hoeflea poritis]